MEIIVKDNKPVNIDFKKKGNILIGNRNLIVITTGKCSSSRFSAVVLFPGETHNKVGDYTVDWSQSCFKFFSGEITIKV